MKRPRLLVAALTLLGFGAYLYTPLPAPAAPAARAGDCVMLRLWTNGYHSDLSVPASALEPDHPLRRLYPQARTFLIGWGDKDFYYSDGHNLWMGLDALIPPSPTVMHVVDGEYDAVYLGPTENVTLAVSREGAAGLSRFLRDALTLDAQGRAEISSTGKVVDHSYFLKARGDFHLFNVCNQWMARALRAAGLDINWRDKWFGGPLVSAARHAAPRTCPAAPGAPI